MNNIFEVIIAVVLLALAMSGFAMFEWFDVGMAPRI